MIRATSIPKTKHPILMDSELARRWAAAIVIPCFPSRQKLKFISRSIMRRWGSARTRELMSAFKPCNFRKRTWSMMACYSMRRSRTWMRSSLMPSHRRSSWWGRLIISWLRGSRMAKSSEQPRQPWKDAGVSRHCWGSCWPTVPVSPPDWAPNRMRVESHWTISWSICHLTKPRTSCPLRRRRSTSSVRQWEASKPRMLRSRSSPTLSKHLRENNTNDEVMLES